jgi:hypothetical protein
MKTTDLMMTMLVASTLALGCDDDGGDDGAGETGGTGHSSAADAGQDDDGGDTSDDGPACSMDSPEGNSCQEGTDCSVACLCANGSVTSGRCVNGACADPDQTCSDACDEFDKGDYSGGYCAVEAGGSTDDGGSADDGNAADDGGVCVPAGDDCEANGDCCGFDGGSSLCTNFEAGYRVCADVCFFDADCVSGCCVPLQEGGSVCGPSDLCV